MAHSELSKQMNSANRRDTPRRDRLAGVWIVADLVAFDREVRSLLTDRLDTVAAAAMQLMERRD
jgi:hypothetical protein